MMKTHKPLCIIPVRGGSKRFPMKNIALLNGKPLLSYAIEAAIESKVFDAICVSSDSEEILEVAQSFRDSNVIALKRPPELATDTAQVKHVCRFLLKHFAEMDKTYDEFALLLATSPFRIAKDIKDAYEEFNRSDANYLISLVEWPHPPQTAVWISQGYVVPYFGIENMKPTQQLDKLYRHDGSIIFAKSVNFLEEGEFYGSKVIPYFIPSERSVDIDHPIGLAWAEFLLSRSKQA